MNNLSKYIDEVIWEKFNWGEVALLIRDKAILDDVLKQLSHYKSVNNMKHIDMENRILNGECVLLSISHFLYAIKKLYIIDEKTPIIELI